MAGEKIETGERKIFLLRSKLRNKLREMHDSLRARYSGFELMDKVLELDRTPLARLSMYYSHELFEDSDHENMLDATDSIFRLDSDPVLSTVLDESVYNLPSKPTRREKKKRRHRQDIYLRRLQKHVYERYLSEAVGRPITIEDYEREFGFLKEENK